MRALLTLLLCTGLTGIGAAPTRPASEPRDGAPPGPTLRRYDTPYYFIHTDLPPEAAGEAVVRMSRLSDELRRRTRGLGFNGRIERRLPFFLYARHADYVAAASVPPESAGVFLGDRLVAAAVDARGGTAWHVVQHEAFHQFADATTGTALPAWLNEGLGEYFGEALFTGDGYVTGVVPAWRAARVGRSLGNDAFQPPATFALVSQEQWNRDMTLTHYDQAWSMVQFLLHGAGGAHADRVSRYVRFLGGRKSHEEAWTGAFGDWPELDAAWEAYWLAAPADEASGAYAEATVATLTSFLARAIAAGQTFDSFDAFTSAGRAGTLRASREDWLPPAMLIRAIEAIPTNTEIALEGSGGSATVAARLPDGRRLVGHFTLRENRVVGVRVIESPAPEP